MKTIVKPGKPIYRDVLISGRFECRNCGCNFLAEKEDMEFENIYISGDMQVAPPIRRAFRGPEGTAGASFSNSEANL